MSYEFSSNGIRVEHSIRLTKPAIRSLQEDKVASQMQAIIDGSKTSQRTARGWFIELSRARNTYTAIGQLQPLREYNRDGAITGEYIYHVWLDVVCTPQKPRPGLDTEFKNILNSIDAKAAYNGKWAASLVDGKTYKAADAVDANLSGDVGYAPIQMPDVEVWGTYFQHLYGLDSHIARVKAALDRAVANNFTKRYHSALIGPPGCGKSDICQSIKTALGEESVLEFDATSTTMAGAQKELQEREELPRVLLIEEIEKVVSDNSSSWLLSVLDMRGEIRKTTARGNILKDTRMVAIATVNDFTTFEKMNYGALASRFMNKIFFQQPSREVLARIILREIRSIGGNEAWSKPTLDYAEEHGIADPREVIAIALCGADGLLDGSYQAHLLATAKPKWEGVQN